MPPRRPIRPLIPALLALSAASLLTACGGPEPPRPNVVFVVCDTLRADRTSTYGHARETTPRLDALAARGVVFDRAFAMSSWTLPAMSMLMTGEVKGMADASILPGHVHVAESFAAAGYETAAVVANPILNEKLGYDRGLGHFVVEPTSRMGWHADEVVEKGLAWLDGREASEEPFFLWLHPVDPHHPYVPADGKRFDELDEGALRGAVTDAIERRRERHPESIVGEPITDDTWAAVEDMRNRYDSEVFEFDRALGAFLDALDERGLLENTVVVVTSDHGEGLWERPTLRDRPYPDDEVPDLYRRHGLMLHDEQVRIPLVFAGPGVPEGERREDWVQHVDVVPTLLALCDVPTKKRLGGRPLFEEGEDVGGEPLYAVCARSHSVTVEERWRLHVPKPFRVEKFGIEPELYDLVNDPDERNPIDDPERIAELTAMVRAWETAHSPVTPGVRLDAEMIDKLKALGYGGEVERANLPRKKETQGEEKEKQR